MVEAAYNSHDGTAKSRRQVRRSNVRFRPIADISARGHCQIMIGIEDYKTNPRSGRPEVPLSWAVERFSTWTGWAISIMCAVGAVAYFESSNDLNGSAQLAGGAVLIALIAYLRVRLLRQKTVALRKAIAVYEDMLTKPLS